MHLDNRETFIIAKTDEYKRSSENIPTSHSLLEMIKLIGRAFRYNMQVPPNDLVKTFVFIDWRC